MSTPHESVLLTYHQLLIMPITIDGSLPYRMTLHAQDGTIHVETLQTPPLHATETLDLLVPINFAFSPCRNLCTLTSVYLENMGKAIPSRLL